MWRGARGDLWYHAPGFACWVTRYVGFFWPCYGALKASSCIFPGFLSKSKIPFGGEGHPVGFLFAKASAGFSQGYQSDDPQTPVDASADRTSRSCVFGGNSTLSLRMAVWRWQGLPRWQWIPIRRQNPRLRGQRNHPLQGQSGQANVEYYY